MECILYPLAFLASLLTVLALFAGTRMRGEKRCSGSTIILDIAIVAVMTVMTLFGYATLLCLSGVQSVSAEVANAARKLAGVYAVDLLVLIVYAFLLYQKLSSMLEGVLNARRVFWDVMGEAGCRAQWALYELALSAPILVLVLSKAGLSTIRELDVRIGALELLNQSGLPQGKLAASTFMTLIVGAAAAVLLCKAIYDEAKLIREVGETANEIVKRLSIDVCEVVGKGVEARSSGEKIALCAVRKLLCREESDADLALEACTSQVLGTFWSGAPDKTRYDACRVFKKLLEKYGRVAAIALTSSTVESRYCRVRVRIGVLTKMSDTVKGIVASLGTLVLLAILAMF